MPCQPKEVLSTEADFGGQDGCSWPFARTWAGREWKWGSICLILSCLSAAWGGEAEPVPDESLSPVLGPLLKAAKH